LTENITMRFVKRWFSREGINSIRNTESFTRLYETTHISVFRYIYGLCNGSQQEVEDLTAETYEKAWKAYQRFDGDNQAALGWLLRIAKNLVVDLYRRSKVRDVDEEADIELLIDPNQLPELDVIAREQIATLWQLLKLLPEETREMLVLRYMLGWQIKQVGGYLGISENTVSVTIRRALKRLQLDWSHLQEKDND